jgi:opacity protein-like surface antigen
MKKLFITLFAIFLLIGNGFAQMHYNPYELNINAPNNENVYKRYMEGKTYLGINGGISLPFADYGKNINLGLGLGIQAKYFISDHFVFGANFNFYNSSFKDDYLRNMDTLFMVVAMGDTTGLKVISVDGNSSLYPFTLNFEYYFSPKQRFKPFVGLGLGFYVINHSIEVITNKEKPQFFREEESKFGSKIDSYFGVTPYVGFMVDFNELMSMDFDVRYNQMFSTPASSSLSVNLGLIFNLAYKY